MFIIPSSYFEQRKICHGWLSLSIGDRSSFEDKIHVLPPLNALSEYASLIYPQRTNHLHLFNIFSILLRWQLQNFDCDGNITKMRLLVGIIMILLPIFCSCGSKRDPKLMFSKKRGSPDPFLMEETMLNSNQFNSGINEAFLDLSLNVEEEEKPSLKTSQDSEKKGERGRNGGGKEEEQVLIPRLRSSNVFQKWEKPPL